MLSKKIIPFCLFTFAFYLVLSASAQNLMVRDIMREPSVAGMRPDSEKLSPDGRRIVFSWNAEGREPRNLYIADSEGGEPRVLVNAEQNFEARTLPPESKLNYGLMVRDDFVKAREKNLGGVEFSPDSKRILFLQNTDIYVLDLEEKPIPNDSQKDSVKNKWQNYETQITRRVDLIPNIIESIKMAGVQEKEIFASVAEIRANLLNAINEKPSELNGDKSEAQKQRVLQANRSFDEAIKRLGLLQENYPQLRSNENFLKIQEELRGTENRIKNAQIGYNDAAGFESLPKPRR